MALQRAGSRSVLESSSLLTLLAVVSATAVACGGRSEEPSVGAEEVPEQIEAAPVPRAVIGPGIYPITPVDESGIEGDLMLDDDGGRMLATLNLLGLAPGSRLAAEVRRGRCQEPGETERPLNPVSSRADGSGESITALTGWPTPESHPAHVRVHGPDGRALACGNLVLP